MFKKYEEELTNFLRSNNIDHFVSVWDDEIQIEIEWGDWKHDHFNVVTKVIEFFTSKGLWVRHTTNITDGDGSDTYSAVHIFKDASLLEDRFDAKLV